MKCSRYLIVMIALALSAEPGLAAGKTAEPSPKSPAKVTETPQKEEKPGKPEPPPEWPRPYKPTEEISADSSVPFPADI